MRRLTTYAQRYKYVLKRNVEDARYDQQRKSTYNRLDCSLNWHLVLQICGILISMVYEHPEVLKISTLPPSTIYYYYVLSAKKLFRSSCRRRRGAMMLGLQDDRGAVAHLYL